jgi:hypothetical protein
MIFFECIAAFELIKDGLFYFLQDVFHFALLYHDPVSLPVMTLSKGDHFAPFFSSLHFVPIILLGTQILYQLIYHFLCKCSQMLTKVGFNKFTEKNWELSSWFT